MLRQYLEENILSLPEPEPRMMAWIAVLKATGGWDENFSAAVLAKIFEAGRHIPPQEISPYYYLLETLSGLPLPMRNDFVMQIIDYLTRDSGNGQAIIYLDAQRHYLYIARNMLLALLPFGPAYAHSFVKKLIAVPRHRFDFYEWIQCIGEFLAITRGLVPEKESEWIAEAISHLDTFSEQESKAELPEDFFLMRALSMVRLTRDLIVYQPESALRSAQRVLQLTEYSGHRLRLQRHIFVHLCWLLDYMQAEIQEEQPQALLAIKIMRLQCAHYQLQVLNEATIEQKKELLQQQKNSIREILNYLIAYRKGSLSQQATAELEEALVMAHDRLKDDMESVFEKVVAAQSGAGLTQAFFVLAQALCLIDSETLRNSPLPWFHRIIRITSRIEATSLRCAGDDLLKPDEHAELALLIKRVASIYPYSVLLLMHSMFSQAKVSEIRSKLEEEAIGVETIKPLLPPLSNIALQHFRDRLLATLALEWIEYRWQDAFLIAGFISDQELLARSITRWLRKSIDFYPQDSTEIATKAYALLQKMKDSRSRTIALIEAGISVAEKDAAQALAIAAAIVPARKRSEFFTRLIRQLDMEKAFIFVAQVAENTFRKECLHTMLCKLPQDVEKRIGYLERIWDLAQQIHDDRLRAEVLKSIVTIGIRRQDLARQSPRLVSLLLDIWDNCSRMPINQAMAVITTTFAPLLELLDQDTAMRLFDNIYSGEYYPLVAGHQEGNTVVIS